MPPASYVTDPANCDTEVLDPYLEQVGIYDNDKPILPIFHDDNTLKFHTRAAEGGGWWEYIIRAADSYGRTNYIALGDSFASGEGARDYYPSTDIPGVNYCHLSKNSYPYLLRSVLSLGSTNSVACSGAKIKNIAGQEWIDDSLRNEYRTNQYLIPENSELGSWTPGYNLQIKKADKQADIITLSIGGNDIGFGEIINKCVRRGTCYESTAERKALAYLIEQQYERLADVYENIKESSAIGSRIYTLGYPHIVKAGGNCGNNVRLNRAETELASSLTSYLNFVIELASRRAGVVYVDMSNSLNGRRLCESSSPAVNGLRTAWGWRPFSTESYHPNKLGHRFMARAVNDKTQGLDDSMPRADSTIEGPGDLAPVIHGLLSWEEADFTLDGLIDFGSQPNDGLAIRGELLEGTATSDTYGLAPNQPFELWLASDPVYLGEFWSDTQGVVSYDALIPNDTPPGWHTLHLQGLSMDGSQIDVQQNIYVAASKDDWDGDGIANADAPCQIVLHNKDTGETDNSWCANPSTSTDPGENENILDAPDSIAPGGHNSLIANPHSQAEDSNQKEQDQTDSVDRSSDELENSNNPKMVNRLFVAIVVISISLCIYLWRRIPRRKDS